MGAMIDAFVSHNSRRTVWDGKRPAPVNYKSWLFERINGSHSLTSLWSGRRGVTAAG
jgi:hypothetical protein